jgi:hypothetical protein
VRSDIVAAIEEEVNHAACGETQTREALFDLWNTLSAEAFQRAPRRLDGVHEAPVLLAFVRQLARQGWAVAQGVPCSSEEIQEARMRMLRGDVAIARSSRGRRLDQQRPPESSNAMRVLSSVLARHARQAWGEAFDARAAATYPVTAGVPGRVGRLRGYGNAIVPQVAATFIEAALDAIGLS